MTRSADKVIQKRDEAWRATHPHLVKQGFNSRAEFEAYWGGPLTGPRVSDCRTDGKASP